MAQINLGSYTYQKSRKKWYASIMVYGKLINLGRFNTSIEAAEAYNEAAEQCFGEFARLNVI